MPNTILLYVLGYTAVFAFGYITGRWHGYLDALPKRDKSGRFTSKD